MSEDNLSNMKNVLNQFQKKEPVDSTMNDEKYPYEIITLPSEGFYYSEENPLSSGKIKLRYPTAKHEDILLSKNLLNQQIAIDEFLKSLIVDYVNYSDILLGDINGIMYAARILLYGPKYLTEVTCPACGKKTENTFDLAGVEARPIDFENINASKGENLFEYTLPKANIKIKFSLLSQKDEQEIKAYTNKMKIKDKDLTTRYLFIIKEVNGIADKKHIKNFIENEFSSMDSSAFRDYYATLNPGVDITAEFVCKECGHQADMDIPLDKNFFWPSRRI